MWNEFNEMTLTGDRNIGGVASSRQEIARHAYLDKVRARQDAEHEAATVGALFGLLRLIAGGTKALASTIGRGRPAVPRARVAR